MDHRRAGLAGQLADRDQRGDHATARRGARARQPRNSGPRHRRRPGRCRPRRSSTVRCRSRRFSGSIGLASWCGKVPSSSKYSGHQGGSAGPRTPWARCSPAIPLPASTTTVSGRMRGHIDQRLEVVARNRTAGRAWRSCRRARRCWAPRPPPCRAARSARCPAPTGRAPSRHSLMPLYLAGLWLAVIIAPAMSELAAARSTACRSSPGHASITAAPWAAAPRGERLGQRRRTRSRMSCTVTTLRAPVSRANAAPTDSRDLLVELVRDDAADIVGLEDLLVCRPLSVCLPCL